MQYRFCENESFEDLSSGRVMIHRSGYTNFPVRLSQEIFGRCLSYLTDKDGLTVYDPCCGGGYLLSVIGFLNPANVSLLIGSDINEKAIDLAKENLALLSIEGMEKRRRHLSSLYEIHGKQSYLDAIESAGRLSNRISKDIISTRTFISDVSNYDYASLDFKANVVITDVPYGQLVSWHDSESPHIDSLLSNIRPILHADAIVAICSDKSQKITSHQYERLEKQSIGKRKFEIFRLKNVEFGDACNMNNPL